MQRTTIRELLSNMEGYGGETVTVMAGPGPSGT